MLPDLTVLRANKVTELRSSTEALRTYTHSKDNITPSARDHSRVSDAEDVNRPSFTITVGMGQ